MAAVPSVMYSPSPGAYSIIPVASVPFTGGLTTPLQASVANPSVGSATIFVNNSEQLSVTDAVGNTYQLVNSPASFDPDVNGHSLTAVGGIAFGGGVQLSSNGAASAVAGAVAIGDSASASVANAISLGAGASNASASTLLVGDAAIANVRPNNTAACDLGTSSAEFKDVWLSNGLRGPLSLASNYSTYADTTCDNTTTETDISATASSVGSLTLAAGQPLGMVFELNLCLVANSVAGDDLALRYYANSGLLFTHNTHVPALSVDLPITVSTHVTIRNGNVHVCSLFNQNGTLTFVISSAIVYDRTISEAWSVTAQWGANASQLRCGQLYTKSYFRG